MLRFLFRQLTREPKRGQALFGKVVADARQAHWYVEGEIPDSIDGRFVVLATICAIYIVRLESGSTSGEEGSAALTERFIESMDSEHRELGLNDPGLGRRVRKLVGALERRVDEWRDAIHGETDWDQTVTSTLYRGEAPKDEALAHSSKSVRALWQRLSQQGEQQLIEASHS
jgi:cytochrome b pre-mRNA-processing protein 3